jgi:hypothetical protein
LERRCRFRGGGTKKSERTIYLEMRARRWLQLQPEESRNRFNYGNPKGVKICGVQAQTAEHEVETQVRIEPCHSGGCDYWIWTNETENTCNPAYDRESTTAILPQQRVVASRERGKGSNQTASFPESAWERCKTSRKLLKEREKCSKINASLLESAWRESA